MILEAAAALSSLSGAAKALRQAFRSEQEKEAAAANIQPEQVPPPSSTALQQATAMIEAGRAEQERLVAEAAVARYERIQAVVDVCYLVAAADGSVSPAEREKIASGLRDQLGEDAGEVGDLLDVSATRLAGSDTKGIAAKVAQRFSDPGVRRAVFLIAAGVSWLDRGIGVKEGLALQAISGAFGIPMNEMHQLLATAAKK